MNYLHWNEKTITISSPKEIGDLYNTGYVFTRIGRGVMQQTRSLRIRLINFQPSSENRRILKKIEGLQMRAISLPLPNYDWKLGKLAKDFYDAKFEPGIMSAQKVKEMTSETDKSNFNALLIYTKDNKDVGYAICYTDNSILHYSYPFYDLNESSKDMGLGMMTLAVNSAKEKGLEYIYLGSLQRPTDTYKLQFSGAEWFDGKEWQKDIESAKKIITEQKKPD